MNASIGEESVLEEDNMNLEDSDVLPQAETSFDEQSFDEENDNLFDDIDL